MIIIIIIIVIIIIIIITIITINIIIIMKYREGVRIKVEERGCQEDIINPSYMSIEIKHNIVESKKELIENQPKKRCSNKIDAEKKNKSKKERIE